MVTCISTSGLMLIFLHFKQKYLNFDVKYYNFGFSVIYKYQQNPLLARSFSCNDITASALRKVVQQPLNLAKKYALKKTRRLNIGFG